MSQLHQFAGNVALPIDGRIGFGQPGVEGDEPTGPQLMVVAGDPNGSVEAPPGTLGLDPATPALWQNAGGTTWTELSFPAAAKTQTLVPQPFGFVNNPLPTGLAGKIDANPPNDLLGGQLIPGPTTVEVPAAGDYVLVIRGMQNTIAGN